MTAFKAQLDEFHGLVDGRVVAIHDMLNTIGTHYPPPPCPALLLCTCLPTPNAVHVCWVSARQASPRRLTAGVPREPSASIWPQYAQHVYLLRHHICKSPHITSVRARTSHLHHSGGKLQQTAMANNKPPRNSEGQQQASLATSADRHKKSNPLRKN